MYNKVEGNSIRCLAIWNFYSWLIHPKAIFFHFCNANMVVYNIAFISINVRFLNNWVDCIIISLCSDICKNKNTSKNKNQFFEKNYWWFSSLCVIDMAHINVLYATFLQMYICSFVLSSLRPKKLFSCPGKLSICWCGRRTLLTVLFKCDYLK